MIAVVLLFACVSYLAFADTGSRRDYLCDIRIANGRPLTKADAEISEYVLLAYAFSCGVAGISDSLETCLARMTEEQYRHAISQAVRATNSRSVHIVFSTGKHGEMGIKALLQLIDDGGMALGGLIEKKSREYSQ